MESITRRAISPRVGVLKLTLTVNRFCPFADAGVIRVAERDPHQGKNGINKALCSSQGQPEYAFNHQYGGDGEVRIVLMPSPRCVCGGLIPGLNSLIIKPESDGAPVDEGFVVVAPVGGFKLLICHGTDSVAG